MNKSIIITISLLTIAMLSACKSNSVKETSHSVLNKSKITQEGQTKTQFAEYIKGKIPQFDKIDELFKMLDIDTNNLIDNNEFSKRMEAIRSLMGNTPTA